MPPSEFARWAVVHGTVATVSDPHEIANVLGEAGVRYMLDDARRSPLKFHFGAPVRAGNRPRELRRHARCEGRGETSRGAMCTA